MEPLRGQLLRADLLAVGDNAEHLPGALQLVGRGGRGGRRGLVAVLGRGRARGRAAASSRGNPLRTQAKAHAEHAQTEEHQGGVFEFREEHGV